MSTVNKLFINGEWLETDSTFDVIDPATGELIGQVADADATRIGKR